MHTFWVYTICKKLKIISYNLQFEESNPLRAHTYLHGRSLAREGHEKLGPAAFGSFSKFKLGPMLIDSYVFLLSNF